MSLQELLGRACNALSGVVAPYAAACFARVYPGAGSLVDSRKVGAHLQQPDAAQSTNSGPAQVDATSAPESVPNKVG